MSNTAITPFRFFTRNVISKGSGVSQDYVFWADGSQMGKQTAFIHFPEAAYKRRAEELAMVAQFAKIGGPVSGPYFAALKAFMVTGFNSSLIFEVDADLNVASKAA